MASLLGWIGQRAKAVEAQVNPFDNGATYNTVRQNVAPPPRTVAQNTATNKSLVNKAFQFGPSALGQALPRVGLGSRDLAINALRTVPRGIAELEASVHLIKPNAVPHPGLGQLLLGKEPIQTSTQSAKQTVSGLPGHKSLPTWAAVPLGVALSAPAGPGKVGRVASKEFKAIEASKSVGQAAKITKPDVAIRSTTGVLNKIDPRLGAMVHQRRELAEVGAAKAKNDLKITNTLSQPEQTNLARVLKGTEKPINNRVAAASAESRKVLDQAYYKAKAVGVPVKARRTNYFPQILNPKSFNQGTKQFDAQVQHLISTKQAKTEADAIGLLRKYKNTRSVSPYGNLIKSRSLDLQGYAENRAALHQYLDKAYATIAHHKIMGPEDKNLNKVLASVRKNGGDVEQAIKSYRQASGLVRGSETGEKLSRVATNIQGTTKLGLSSILNATQPANTAVIAGIGRTAKTYGKALARRDKEFIAKTGVTDEQVAHEALFSEQGVTKGLRKVTAPLFEAVEKQNRASAGLAGKDLADSLAKRALKGDARAASRLRSEFGITNIPKTGLREADQIKAARNMVERSQFRTGNQDLPGWTGTPLGKVGSQFRRYPLKQAQFLSREVIKPLARGNVLPAARLAAIGVPVGLGAHTIQDKIRGGSFQNTPAETGLQTFNNATGGDLLTSLARSLIPGSSVDGNAYTTKVIKALGGPTVSDAAKAAQAGFEATKGKPANAARFGLTHVPVVGTPVSNRAVPYPQSKTDKTSAAVQQTGNPDIASIKANPPKGYSVQKTSDGRYAYTLNDGSVQTSKDLQTAQTAIANDVFKTSGDSYKIVGNKVLRKSPDGSVSTITKDSFDYKIGTATMTSQKNAGDIEGYLKTANSQLDLIAKQLKDPNIDPLDALTLQNEATALQKNIDKYTGYGGFTKPKSGSRSSKSAKAVGSFKTTSTAKAVARPKGVSVRVPKASFKAPKTRKLSVSKIPSNYLNKKLV